MTGRSNSATTSRMIWMLSASSARRWSSWRLADGGGDVATVDIRKIKKARWTFVRRASNCLLAVFLRDSGFYPNSRAVAPGTSEVLIQQHEQQQVEADTTPRFYIPLDAQSKSRFLARGWRQALACPGRDHARRVHPLLSPRGPRLPSRGGGARPAALMP